MPEPPLHSATGDQQPDSASQGFSLQSSPRHFISPKLVKSPQPARHTLQTLQIPGVDILQDPMSTVQTETDNSPMQHVQVQRQALILLPRVVEEGAHEDETKHDAA